jgi:hypothetical protein
MPIKIRGWPEGHPHLTTIDNYAFGYPQPKSRNPLLNDDSDGYTASFRKLYKSYRARASKKGKEFDLSEEDFFQLTSQPCFYCAAPPSQGQWKGYKNPYIYNGLDREDYTKGYTLRNCRPCCWMHNDLKGKLTFHEFYRHSLAVVLSVSSRTALDLGDLRSLELLMELFPNVRFLSEDRLALLEDMRRNPRKRPFNWRPKSGRSEPK